MFFGRWGRDWRDLVLNSCNYGTDEYSNAFYILVCINYESLEKLTLDVGLQQLLFEQISTIVGCNS